MPWERFKSECLARATDPDSLNIFLEADNDCTRAIEDLLGIIEHRTFGVECLKLTHLFLLAIAREEKVRLPEIIPKLSICLDKISLMYEEPGRMVVLFEHYFKIFPVLQEVLLQICIDLIEYHSPLTPMRTLSSRPDAGFQDTDDIFRMYGPRPDRLVTQDRGVFYEALTAYLESKGKQVLMLSGGGGRGNLSLRWIRDPVISTSRGRAIASLQDDKEARAKRILEGAYTKYQHYIYDRDSETSPYLGLSNQTRDLSEEEQRIFASLNIKFHLEHALRIPGGNVIKATNKDGTLIYIVGLAAVFSILWTSYADVLDTAPDLTPRQLARLGTLTGENVKFYQEFKKTKRIIRKFLIDDPIDPTKRVIFIDHVSYHIDLDLLYIGPGLIFVNSYSKFLEFGPAVLGNRDITEFDRTHYLDYFRKLNQQFGRRIAHLIFQLQKKNFDIVPVAGSSFHFHKIDFTQPSVPGISISPLTNNEHIERWSLSNAFCFINGIVIQNSEDPKDCDLLIGSSLPRNLSPLVKFFYDRFFELLMTTGKIRHLVPIWSYGEELEYKDTDGITRNLPCTSENYMYAFKGGLRCSVNKIHGSQFSPMDLVVRR